MSRSGATHTGRRGRKSETDSHTLKYVWKQVYEIADKKLCPPLHHAQEIENDGSLERRLRKSSGSFNNTMIPAGI